MMMLNRLILADLQSKRLFHDCDYERSRRVMRAVDEIYARHGHDTVRLGAARPGTRWETKFQRRSPRYTTQLKEMLSVA